MSKSTLSIAEAAIVSAICFGIFIVLSIAAVFAGFPEVQFSDARMVSMIFYECILATAAILFLRARGFDLRSLYPRPTVRDTLFGLAIFFAVWLLGAIVTWPFADSGESMQIRLSVAELSFPSVVASAIVNGAFEEIFLLGVLVKGLRGYGLSFAISAPLLVRVLYHLYQGPLGAIWILSFGLTLTLFYIRSQRLWPPVLAHILCDIVPFIGLLS